MKVPVHDEFGFYYGTRMLYLRFEVTRPDTNDVAQDVSTTAHLMFVSENIRMCTAEALALLRHAQCRGIQLKEARIGDPVEEFIGDEALFRLTQKAVPTGIAHEFVDHAAVESEAASAAR